jgi:molybdopterin molybdotransferase
MLEMTNTPELGGQAVRTLIRKELPPGSNITPIAGEIEEGELLLEQGTRIGAGEAALLATFGHGTVAVHRRPRVAIFSTGSELLNVEDKLQPGRIRNSNSYMLAAQVESAGGLPTIGKALSDNVNQVQEALIEAFEAYDLVITSGGVSVGDYDVLVDLFGRWEGRLLFNKVAMRPGSPTSAAEWQGKLLLALSGNPGASFVGFELFARPLMDAMQGSKNPFPKVSSAFLDVDYDKGSAHPRYVRGTTRVEDGRLLVRPAGADKSSIMVSIKDADCLILLPAGGSGFAKGARVSIFFLANH